MTSYFISGVVFRLEGEYFTSLVDSASQTFLEIIAPEGSFISYETGPLVSAAGDLPSALLDTGQIIDARLNGVTIQIGGQTSGYEDVVVTYHWKDGNIIRETTVLVLSVADHPGYGQDVAFLFELGGHPLPQVNSTGDWFDFATTIVEFSAPTSGPFAPGTDIPLGNLISQLGPLKTYTIDGISVRPTGLPAGATDITPVELVFTAPEQASFRYEVQPGEQFDVDLDLSQVVDLSINGASEGLTSINEQITVVEWQDGNSVRETTVLSFSAPSDSELIAFLVYLDGDPLPDLETPQDFVTFDQSILSVGIPSSGPYAPETDIFLAELFGVSVEDAVSGDAIAADLTTDQSLVVGATVLGEIQQDDVSGDDIDADYYEVTLSGGRRYTFTADARIDGSDTLDEVFIRLRNSDGQPLTADVFDEGSTPSFVFDVPGTGVQIFYLAISAGGGGEWRDKTGSYSISLAETGGEPTGSAPEVDLAAIADLLIAGSPSSTFLAFNTDVIEVSDADGDLLEVTFTITQSGDGGGYLRLDGGPADEDGILTVGSNGIDRVTYVTGSNEGTSKILVEAVDAAGNRSSDTIAINVQAPGSNNEAPSLNLTSAVSVAGGEVSIIDVNATDDNDSEGNGLTYSLLASVDRNLFDINSVTGLVSYIVPTGIANNADGNGDGIYELSVQVVDNDGLISSQDLKVSVRPDELQSASSIELEYFARQSAYDRGPLGGVNPSDPTSSPNLDAFLSGWTVQDEFGGNGANFRAILLQKNGFNPVLAFRGSTDAADWAENFDQTGISVSEFDEGLSLVGPSSGETLETLLLSSPNISITGHSQGAAQAQLAAIKAFELQNGNYFGEVATFNSPGIPSADAAQFFEKPDQVTHYVNASDIVSVAGEAFITGDLVYYDFEVPMAGLSPLGIRTAIREFVNSHSGHWAQEDFEALGLGVYPDALRPVQLSASGPSFGEFSSGTYSPLGEYGQDDDFSSSVFLVLGALFLAAKADIAAASISPFYSAVTGRYGEDSEDFLEAIIGLGGTTNLEAMYDDFVQSYDTRSGLESFRKDWGPEFADFLNGIDEPLNALIASGPFVGEVLGLITDLGRFLATSAGGAALATVDLYVAIGNTILDGVELAGQTIVGLGDFLIDSAEGALLQTWASANDLANWVGERFAPEESIVVAEGSHSGSTPAVVLDVIEASNEVLSSSSSGSIFLLTDPGTTVETESGGNIFWGVAEDQADTYVTGGVSETDVHFIQNAFFETDDLDLGRGSAIIGVDLDQDGETDITITWEGDYQLERIAAEQGTDGTYIRYLGNSLAEATNDQFSTDKASVFTTGNVLANDREVDGEALSVVGFDTTGTLGLVTDNGDGTFAYDPNGAFDALVGAEFARDRFVYSVSDGIATVAAEVVIFVTGVQGITVIEGTPEQDILNGSDGIDLVFSRGSSDEVNTFGGNDTINGGIGPDVVNGGPDDDTITGGDGFDILSGDAGDDTIRGNAGNDTINGGAGDDILNGGIGSDTIDGGADNDTINGNDGFDILSGGGGNDTINGNAGNDTIRGGDGNDTLNGGIGFDTIFGEDGDDTIFGLEGFDTLSGGDGEDTIQGNAGNDQIDAGADDDFVEGGQGADTILGGGGNDTLRGQTGGDTISGGDGDDTILGGEGADRLSGDADDDMLTGGAGADVFVFNDGQDTITDFSVLVDGLELDAVALDIVGLTGAQVVTEFGEIVAGDTVLTFDTGDILTLTGITNSAAVLGGTIDVIGGM